MLYLTALLQGLIRRFSGYTVDIFAWVKRHFWFSIEVSINGLISVLPSVDIFE